MAIENLLILRYFQDFCFNEWNTMYQLLSVGTLMDLKLNKHNVNFDKRYFMDSLLDKEMFTYFKRLSEEEKRSLLQLLKSFLGRRNESTGRATIDQYNKEIDEALEDVENGNFLTQEEVESRAAKW